MPTSPCLPPGSSGHRPAAAGPAQPSCLSKAAPERAVALALALIPPGQSARLLLVTDGLSGTTRDRIAAPLPCLSDLFAARQAQPAARHPAGQRGKETRLPGVAAERWQLGSPIGHTLPAPDEEAMTALAASTGGRLAWLDSGLPALPLPMGQALTQGQSRISAPGCSSLAPLALLARIGAHWLLVILVIGFAPFLQAASRQDEAGWQAYRQGHYREAANAFQDPVWQGNAWYRSGDYARAVAAYGGQTAPLPTTTGNALVCSGSAASGAGLSERPA